MQSAEAVLDIIRERGSAPPGMDHWRAVCRETDQHGSGRGRRKRTRTAGVSPAAYSTLGSTGLPGRESARGQEHARKAVADQRRSRWRAARPA